MAESKQTQAEDLGELQANPHPHSYYRENCLAEWAKH